jgi:hypothetical protein
MKKFAIGLLLAGSLLAFFPYQSIAAANVTPSSLAVPVTAGAAEAKTLLLRLDEINAMDKKNLKPSEKKNLRMEVRSIKHQLRELGDGVYISVGAAIIILLLLIILL